MYNWMKRTVGISLFLGLFSFTAFGQKNCHDYPTRTLESNPQQELNEWIKTLEGTFQIQIRQQDYSVLVTRELLEKVRQARQSNQAVYLEWDAVSTIYIPSYREIESSTFQKLTPSIYLINANSNE